MPTRKRCVCQKIFMGYTRKLIEGPFSSERPEKSHNQGCPLKRQLPAKVAAIGRGYRWLDFGM